MPVMSFANDGSRHNRDLTGDLLQKAGCALQGVTRLTDPTETVDATALR